MDFKSVRTRNSGDRWKAIDEELQNITQLTRPFGGLVIGRFRKSGLFLRVEKAFEALGTKIVDLFWYLVNLLPGRLVGLVKVIVRLGDIAICRHRHFRKSLEIVREELDGLALEFARIDYLERRLDKLVHRGGMLSAKVPVADDDRGSRRHSVPAIDFDHFYYAFEQKFRGDPAEISKRQKTYFDRIPVFSRKGILGLDIACGRGEWLSLLQENEVKAIGVDANLDAIQVCRKKNLEVTHKDAFEFLEGCRDEYFDFITAFHLIEHLPFEANIRLIRLAYRKLKSGGVLVIETPNIANILVSASTFHLDPTHRNPIHPDFCSFMFEYCQFQKVEIIPLHSNEALRAKNQDKVPPEILDLLWGSSDFACVGYKP